MKEKLDRINRIEWMCLVFTCFRKKQEKHHRPPAEKGIIETMAMPLLTGSAAEFGHSASLDRFAHGFSRRRRLAFGCFFWEQPKTRKKSN
jgi:hypothetical protein